MANHQVKVHVRRVMKKLKAKNRTDAAIKSQTVLSTFRTNTCLELSAWEFLGRSRELMKKGGMLPPTKATLLRNRCAYRVYLVPDTQELRARAALRAPFDLGKGPLASWLIP